MGRATRAAGLALAAALGASAWITAAPAAPAIRVAAPTQSEPAQDCDWPQWGQAVQRDFSYPCETDLAVDTVADLQPIWFFNSRRHGDGDARGRRLDPVRGRLVGQLLRARHEDGEATLALQGAAARPGLRRPDRVVGRGRGRRRRRRPSTSAAARRCTPCAPRTGRCAGATRSDGPATTTTRPRSSRRRVVVDDMVVFGSDVHNSADGEPAGVYALDAATGEERWRRSPPRPRARERPGRGAATSGARPTVDVERGSVFVGTGNCHTSPEGLGPLHRGAHRARPRDRRRALDVPAPRAEQRRPRLRRRAQPVRRRTGASSSASATRTASTTPSTARRGELVWKTQVTEPGIEGQNFSTGGFIGATAVRRRRDRRRHRRGRLPRPARARRRHRRDRWQQTEAGPTYASTAIANGVVFIGGTPTSRFRAVDLATGDVLWSTGDAGRRGGRCRHRRRRRVRRGRHPRARRRQPRTATAASTASRSSAKPVTSKPASTVPRTPSTPPNPAAAQQECIAAPCDLDFSLTSDRLPPGSTPTGTLQVSIDPFRARGAGRRAGRAPQLAPPGQRRRRRRARRASRSSSRRAPTTRRAGSCACSTRTTTARARSCPLKDVELRPRQHPRGHRHQGVPVARRRLRPARRRPTRSRSRSHRRQASDDAPFRSPAPPDRPRRRARRGGCRARPRRPGRLCAPCPRRRSAPTSSCSTARATTSTPTRRSRRSRSRP